ncbi:MAG: cupin domain-containing protein [Bacteroidetes bacterium]|nr:cupin domain-containing protein [Bacteroidota bacterium]
MATVIIEKLSAEAVDKLGIRNWPLWEKEVSRFPNVYDETEQCLFLEGEVIIETDHGQFFIKPGDFVTFENGLDCIWDIRKDVKKHYNFL